MRIDVAFVGDQNFCRCFETFVDGMVKRCLCFVVFVRCVDVGAFGQQQFDHPFVAPFGGQAQRSLTQWAIIGYGAVDIRAIGQQQFGGGDVARLRRALQRCVAAVHGRVN